MESPTCPLDQLKARYLAEHCAKNHSPKTIQRYEATFDDLHRFCAAAGKPWDTSLMTSESMLAFGAWLRETPAKVWRGTTERSIYTVHGRLKDLRSFTRWLADEEQLRQAPKIHLPKLPETIFPILSDDQLRELFCCGHLSGMGEQAIRNRALISLLLDTGMRLSEIAGLPLEAVDFEQCMAKVTGKGNKQRFVFFSSGVAAYLAAWMQIRGTEAGPLFWLTARGIQMLFKRIQGETGLPVHAHLLRHQSATILVRNNADLHSVRRMLGHAQLSTLEKYVSLSTKDLQDKHAAASPFESVRALIPEPEKKPRRKRLSL